MKGVVVIVFLILLMPIVNGLGVAQEFLKDDLLRLEPGEEYNFKVIVQNPDEISINVSLEVTGDIIEIKDGQNSYELASKSFDNQFYLIIKAPKKAQLGSKYPVSYAVAPYSTQEGGQIDMNLKIKRNFDVEIVDSSGRIVEKTIYPKTLFSVLFIVLTIAVLSVVFLLLMKKSNSLSKTISSITSKKKPIKKMKFKQNESINKEINNLFEEKKSSSFKKQKMINKKTIVNEQKKISPNEYFNFQNGTILKSLKDLYNYLQVMPDEVFRYHVNDGKNDFANWIEGVFKKTDLANGMRTCKSKEEMRTILKDEI